mmetsp:Transcript_14302/g.23624  ORF Transcript_14302/g.23624 Transcript_14302/m.23624 type:complete len:813 (-) Transcript_14302:454-2892(-)|eukprot:CAMPEP_0184650482 /NCGR_PEP_ID=MMETSP0308-20130426/8008_1 /TAXON_ID=38269 /ORGANISM="Gloeochaete witrockiana, Strain SAG 46.84" /LENGTH=812 /DNA_ID=CAMNT_0027084021 /DNA_START=118 /DNA_END=2556 /DNA_ORIENTATION=-
MESQEVHIDIDNRAGAAKHNGGNSQESIVSHGSKKKLQARALTLSTPPITLSWQNVTLEQKLGAFDKKEDKNGNPVIPRRFLTDVSGLVGPGDMLCVMGPSGAGKTTMLDALADRITSGQLYGEVYVNGQPKDRMFRRVMGYVPQADRLFGVLTAREQLIYSARLRITDSHTYHQKLERVEEIILALGLTKSADTKVGGTFVRGLSGGERRRLSIGLELVTGPSLLFLDEPTSALDSFSAFNVVELMKSLADQGRTLVATIHSPDFQIFSMFTKLMLLSQGKVVYFGPTAKVIKYFSSIGHPCPTFENPAEYYLRLINIDFFSQDDKAEAENHLNKLISAFADSTFYGNLIKNLQTIGHGKIVPHSNSVPQFKDVADVFAKGATGLKHFAENTGAVFQQAGDAISNAIHRDSPQLPQNPTPTEFSVKPVAQRESSVTSDGSVHEYNNAQAPLASAKPDDEDDEDELIIKSQLIPIASFIEKEHGLSKYATGRLTQFNTLMSRASLIMLRDPEYMLIRCVSFGIVGIVLGTSFLQSPNDQQGVNNRMSVFFGVSSFLTLLAIGVMPSLIAERDVVKFERSNGAYRVEAFVMSQLLASLPWLILMAVISSVTLYWIVGLNPTAPNFFTFMFVMLGLLITAESIVLIVILISPFFIIAVSLYMNVSGYFFMQMGFLIPPNQMQVFWLYVGYYVSASTYAYNAWLKNEFLNRIWDTAYYCQLLSPPGTPCVTSTGIEILSSMGIPGWSLWIDVLILYLQALAYRVIYYVLLKIPFAPKTSLKWKSHEEQVQVDETRAAAGAKAKTGDQSSRSLKGE